MPKKYLKYIKSLPKNLREKLEKLVKKIEILELKGIDTKKLSGFQNIFRYSSGKIRIVFEKKDDKGNILEIDTRGDIY